MPRTALSIITRANQRAKTGGGPGTGYFTQAIDELNDLLDHIAATVDFSAARGVWSFVFNANLATAGGGNIITSGPNFLPMDYLRVGVSGGSSGAQMSSIWYLDGVPYPMVEIDLTEFDIQVQQAGVQSYPYFWAKDMAQRAIFAEIQGDLNTASTAVANVSSVAGLTEGMSISGGLGPLVLIQPGTTITALTVGPPATLTLSVPPAVPVGQAAMALTGCSLTVGYPAAAYAYPPPSGAYNVQIRYQRRMPPLTATQINAGAFCWFEDDETLTAGLTGLMMEYSDDSRSAEFIGDGLGSPTGRGGKFGARMTQYIRQADDLANRAQVVELDRRVFATNLSFLANTKRVGWLVFLGMWLGGMAGAHFGLT